MVGLVIVLETVLEAIAPSDGVAHAAMERVARREGERRLGGVEHKLMQGILQNGDHIAILFLLHHSPQPGIEAGVCGSRGVIRHWEKAGRSCATVGDGRLCPEDEGGEEEGMTATSGLGGN